MCGTRTQSPYHRQNLRSSGPKYRIIQYKCILNTCSPVLCIHSVILYHASFCQLCVWSIRINFIVHSYHTLSLNILYPIRLIFGMT